MSQAKVHQLLNWYFPLIYGPFHWTRRADLTFSLLIQFEWC